jgi:hypothetical protein
MVVDDHVKTCVVAILTKPLCDTMASVFLLVAVMIVSLAEARQEWVEQPVGVAVNPGEEAVLTCRLVGKKGDCRWERNGLPVGLYQGKYEWAGNPAQGDCSLRLREASIQYDQGDWVCQVTASSFMEKDTLISSPAKLIVRGKTNY